MSILAQQNQTTDEVLLQNRANQIKAAPRQLAELMFNQWSASFNALWGQGGKFTPAQKLEAIGTDAAELFLINTQFVTFMVTQLTGKRDDLVAKIQELVATIPACTVHPDGTVTIDE